MPSYELVEPPARRGWTPGGFGHDTENEGFLFTFAPESLVEDQARIKSPA